MLGGYEPFHDDDQGLSEQRIAMGVFAFHEENWCGVYRKEVLLHSLQRYDICIMIDANRGIIVAL